MKANNIFSFRRFWLLCKQSLIINKKIIGMSIIGVIGLSILALLFIQSNTRLQSWEVEQYLYLFFFPFFILGIIYTSLSFPAFRSKEKSISYLTLPASITEKYVFEIVSRIIVFMIVYPLLFWAVVNAECAVVHHYAPHFKNYQFSFSAAYLELIKDHNYINGKIQYTQVEQIVQYIFIQGGLLAFILSFAGASHFSKSPLLKTLFSLSIIIAGYFLLGYLLYKILDLKDYNPKNEKILFMNIKNDMKYFVAYAFTILNLCFLAISFFRLKEKEV